MPEVICYNKGCGKGFSLDNNPDNACQYHPGAPIFHEEFLNTPGCTRGAHSNVKPVQPVKEVAKPMEVGEVIEQRAPERKREPIKPLERPADDIELVPLRVIVGASLKSALKKFKDKAVEAQANGTDDSVQIGASCKNNTCEAKYTGTSADDSACIHHPGVPIFHEGYKYWSCCTKKTSEFDEFLKQVGCTRGAHAWMRPSEVAQKKSTCRYDHHQTGPNVILSIYAKVCDPEKCSVKVNPTNLSAKIAFNGGTNTFELDLKLHGVIVPEESSVEYLGTKAEIKLRKRDLESWPRLELKTVS